MILAIKSDTKDTLVGLFEGDRELVKKEWPAGRELSDQLLSVIEELLRSQKSELANIDGLVVFEGPGSYTGLRIGISVANAIGGSYDVPVVGVSGDDWLEAGISRISKEHGFKPISPVYGGEVFTTKPRK